jgi:hypothetical protein
MRCQAVICAACCTRVEGVNHCHACLKALGERPESSLAKEVPIGLVTFLFLLLGWGVFFALAWGIQGRLAP